jgi:hypothetical protein
MRFTPDFDVREGLAQYFENSTSGSVVTHPATNLVDQLVDLRSNRPAYKALLHVKAGPIGLVG